MKLLIDIDFESYGFEDYMSGYHEDLIDDITNQYENCFYDYTSRIVKGKDKQPQTVGFFHN